MKRYVNSTINALGLLSGCGRLTLRGGGRFSCCNLSLGSVKAQLVLIALCLFVLFPTTLSSSVTGIQDRLFTYQIMVPAPGKMEIQVESFKGWDQIGDVLTNEVSIAHPEESTIATPSFVATVLTNKKNAAYSVKFTFSPIICVGTGLPEVSAENAGYRSRVVYMDNTALSTGVLEVDGENGSSGTLTVSMGAANEGMLTMLRYPFAVSFEFPNSGMLAAGTYQVTVTVEVSPA